MCRGSRFESYCGQENDLKPRKRIVEGEDEDEEEDQQSPASFQDKAFSMASHAEAGLFPQDSQKVGHPTRFSQAQCAWVLKMKKSQPRVAQPKHLRFSSTDYDLQSAIAESAAQADADESAEAERQSVRLHEIEIRYALPPDLSGGSLASLALKALVASDAPLPSHEKSDEEDEDAPLPAQDKSSERGGGGAPAAATAGGSAATHPPAVGRRGARGGNSNKPTKEPPAAAATPSRKTRVSTPSRSGTPRNPVTGMSEPAAKRAKAALERKDEQRKKRKEEGNKDKEEPKKAAKKAAKKGKGAGKAPAIEEEEEWEEESGEEEEMPEYPHASS